MKKYFHYQADKTQDDISDEDLKKVKWTEFKIIVPTQADKDELMKAFQHIHYSDVDTDYVVVNQLAHLYLDESAEKMIIVDENLYKKL